MDRRTFLLAAAAVPAAADVNPAVPTYRVVTPYKRQDDEGMPGRYPGKVVRTHSGGIIDEATNKVDEAMLRRMFSEGMRSLTGAKSERDAWAGFFSPSDVVGIKVNCSGAPNIMSRPEVVAEIIRNLNAVGVAPERIWIYERFPSQIFSVHYDRYIPKGVNIQAIEMQRGSIANYDPRVYVEVDFFGEEDTRSNMIRLVTERFTKIINVPNIKDHGAAGVTGCLKNIAYGDFSNVARSHYRAKTNTLTYIGTLATVEPLRSKTTLHIMDGLRGVWQGGPFVLDPSFVFYPKQIVFGTDPVSIDRLELDVVENKRKAEGALSIWDRNMANISFRDAKNPHTNRFIREPGHIEYASKLGLGVYDINRIQLKEINL